MGPRQVVYTVEQKEAVREVRVPEVRHIDKFVEPAPRHPQDGQQSGLLQRRPGLERRGQRDQEGHEAHGPEDRGRLEALARHAQGEEGHGARGRTADADGRGLPQSCVGGLENRLVGQGAGT